MKIWYSPPNEIDLAGSPTELRALQRGLLDALRKGDVHLTSEADTDVDPTPYATMLRSLTIESASGRVRVSVSDEKELHISGSNASLEGFASWLETAEDSQDG